MDCSPGYMLRNANTKGQPCICVGNMLLACQVQLCMLFGASLTWVQSWECLCLKGPPMWTLPGVVSRHARVGVVNQVFLVAGGRGATHSSLWASRTYLAFSKWKFCQGPAGSGQVCLSESFQAARTVFMPCRIGSSTWCNSLWVPWLVECAPRPDQESRMR